MTRLALFAAGLGLVAASPALAYSVQTMPAPHVEAHFTNTSVFGALGVVDDVSAPAQRDTPAQGSAPAKKTVVNLPKKGRSAERINYSDPDDNPFMAPRLKDDDGKAAARDASGGDHAQGAQVSSSQVQSAQAKADPAPAH